MTDYPIDPIDLSQITTYSLADRKSKVSQDDFAQPARAGQTLADFLSRLPNILAAQDLRQVVQAVVTAHQNSKRVIMAMGAHVIKVGLNPLLIDLMHRNIVDALAMNGAGIIHDLEIALCGQTSEDVAAVLGDGQFGMSKETADFLNQAIAQSHKHKMGLGECVGRAIWQQKLPFAEQSLLGQAWHLQIPVTVHVAMGTDILHMHPQFDPAQTGQASHLDFRRFASLVAGLEKGVYFNIGSAVIMPEVFLKALTLVRNLGHTVNQFTTVNLDFIRHYRSMTNVVNRPTAHGGQGINLVGHHEIMLPLIVAGIVEGVSQSPPAS